MGGITKGQKKKITPSKDYVSWFEIPALDFQQAVTFYNHIFDFTMEQNVAGVNSVAFFPATSGVSGSVVAGQGYVPSDSGPLIYLNGGNDLNKVLNKVEPAGGRVVMPKTLINDEVGYFGIFIDSQGNKLAIYSKN